MIYIMRGLPGSGKTTWWRNNAPNAIVCSADDYHIVDGVYKYDPKKAGEAHNMCLLKYINSLMCDNDIVVDNTNTSLVELAPYVRIAEASSMEYTIVYIDCSLKEAIRRGTHNVPSNTILTMQRNLLTEIVPSYWNQIYRG